MFRQVAERYNNNIGDIRAESIRADNDGMVMQKEEVGTVDKITSNINGIMVGVMVAISVALMVILVRKRKKQTEE